MNHTRGYEVQCMRKTELRLVLTSSVSTEYTFHHLHHKRCGSAKYIWCWIAIYPMKSLSLHHTLNFHGYLKLLKSRCWLDGALGLLCQWGNLWDYGRCRSQAINSDFFGFLCLLSLCRCRLFCALGWERHLVHRPRGAVRCALSWTFGTDAHKLQAYQAQWRVSNTSNARTFGCYYCYWRNVIVKVISSVDVFDSARRVFHVLGWDEKMNRVYVITCHIRR